MLYSVICISTSECRGLRSNRINQVSSALLIVCLAAEVKIDVLVHVLVE